MSEKISGEHIPCCFELEFLLDVMITLINVVYDLFWGTQDYPGATRAMQTIVRIQPTDINILAGIGRLYLQVGRLDTSFLAAEFKTHRLRRSLNSLGSSFSPFFFHFLFPLSFSPFFFHFLFL